MTALLALDSSTDACSAALIHDESIMQRFEIAPRQHTTLLPAMIRDLMGEAGMGFDALDAVAFARGPGSFAGLRIACGLAQGIALATGCRIYPVSTLAAMALQPLTDIDCNLRLATLDARLGELYLGLYRVDSGVDSGSSASLTCIAEDRVAAPDAIDRATLGLVDPDEFVVVGNGWSAVPSIERRLGAPAASKTDLRPRAAEVARLAMEMFQKGAAGALDEALPVYLRDNVAARPK